MSEFANLDLNPRISILPRRTIIAAASVALTGWGSAAPPVSASSRVPGIGGGFDIQSPPPLQALDAVFPASMQGVWQCERVVVQVEGDAGQAEIAWRCLGGSSKSLFAKGGVELFSTQFIKPPSNIPTKYIFEGKELQGVILDRAFELKARCKSTDIVWDPSRPSLISFDRVTDGMGKTELEVLQRTIELPGEKGFGFNELVCVTTPAGGLFGDSTLKRVARVQRRYRRSFDKDGGRVVEGLEIVKTYRVLDGVAGVEMPTSTTKSSLRLTRPLT